MVFSFHTFLGRFVSLEVERGKAVKYMEDIREWAAVCSSHSMMKKQHYGEMMLHYGEYSSERKKR